MGKKGSNPPPPNWPRGLEVQKHMGLLGLKVKDEVTGFRGVVSSICFDLYGCIQAVVTPPAGDNGKQEDCRYYDITRLKIINKKPVMARPNFDYGYVAEGKKGAAEKPAL